MRRSLIVLAILVICIRVPSLAESQQWKREFLEELRYRQAEFYKQGKYLSNREMETAEKLNKEVDLYNREPSVVILQRIENLKSKIVENLQDQVLSNRDYIAYLEQKLSKLLDYKFEPLKFKDKGEVEEAYEEVPEGVVLFTLEEESEKIEELQEKPTKPAKEVTPSKLSEDYGQIKKRAERLMKKVEPLRFELEENIDSFEE